MYYTYILLLKNGDLYKGSSNNLRQRLTEHTQGKVEATKHQRPFKLILYECYLLRSDAERRERFLKTTEGRRLLKQQIRDSLKELNMLP